MYLPRNLISHLYNQLLRTNHPLSPPVLILVALEPDALCACRILTALLKRDFISHKIRPIAGYGDLERAGKELIQPMRHADGGSGGVVVSLGVGGLCDLEELLGLAVDENGTGGFDGVDVWVFDSRRPWNLANVFAGFTAFDSADGARQRIAGLDKGQLSRAYQPGKGGIIVYDDGDIEQELGGEREAWSILEDLPELGNEEDDYRQSDDENPPSKSPGQSSTPRKRKSWTDQDDEEESGSEKENTRPAQKRRSNSSSPIPSSPSTPSRDRRNRAPLIQGTPPSNQMSSMPTTSPPAAPPSPRRLRRQLLRTRRKHEAIIDAYRELGTSYSEPVSSIMYSLASELGREDNDLLWHAIIGVSSMELYGRTNTGISLINYDVQTPFVGWTGSRGSRIRQLLRDEVNRLNPSELTETGREIARGHATDVIPTRARSPTDTSIRLSPEPRFLLIRHWSLYDSMLHSPYLSARLHIWSDNGRRRLHKLLAKMGVSLSQCKQSYTHMDVELKKMLREKLLKFAPMYGLDGLVPPVTTRGGDKEGWGFVRCWGWKACLSAVDVAVILGAILEVGKHTLVNASSASSTSSQSANLDSDHSDEIISRFYTAYDALLSPTDLMQAIPLAQSLHRSILRTGTSLLQKRQIRHLRAFRLAMVKEGPDVALFCHPGALTKLALWVGEAVAEAEHEDNESDQKAKGPTPLVVGSLDEERDTFIVVGTGGGGSTSSTKSKSKDPAARKARQEQRDTKSKARKERQQAHENRRREAEDRGEDVDTESDESESDSEASSSSSESSEDEGGQASRKDKGFTRNKFGNAFQDVIAEMPNVRVKLDSFEHCVIEVRREDMSSFLERLSMRAVVG